MARRSTRRLARSSGASRRPRTANRSRSSARGYAPRRSASTRRSGGGRSSGGTVRVVIQQAPAPIATTAAVSFDTLRKARF